MEAKVFDLNPKPDSYDAYVCNLSEELQKVAKDELREDQNTRAQALAQFREWIAKHPKITHCRTDAPFLLAFLRPRKFSMIRSFELLENFLSFKHKVPEFFKNLDIEDPTLSEAFDTGIAFILNQRDSKERLVSFTNFSDFDLTKLTATDMVRVITLNTLFYINDEQAQVAGCVIVADFKGLSLKWSVAFSLNLLKKCADCLNNSNPLRIKEFHFFNVPAATVTCFSLVLSLFSEKNQKRVHFHQNVEEMKPFFDIRLLPKEYGGTTPMSDMIAAEKEKLRKCGLQLAEDQKMFKNVKTSLNEFDSENAVGSFRKLEID